MSPRSRRLVTTFCLASCTAVPALHAQVPLTPRSLGTADALLALARGHEALFLNPANLGLRDGPGGSLAFAQFGIGGTLAGTTIEDLPDWVDASGLSDQRKAELFGSVPLSGITTDIDLRLPLVAFQWRHFAVGVAYGHVEGIALSRSLAELIIFGYEDGRGDYEVGSTGGTRAQFWDVALAYGTAVGPVSIGATAHYIRGGSLQRWWLQDPKIDFASDDIEITAPAAIVRGGNGFGIDVGAAIQTSGFTVGAAIANAFGFMSWSDELRIRDVTLRNEDFEDSEQIQDFLLGRDGNERTASSADAALLNGVTANGLQQQAYFPTTLRLGAAWHAPTATNIAVGMHTALTQGRLAGTWDNRVSVGIEQKLAFVSLRAGVGTDLDERTMVAGGLSLGPVHVGVARLGLSKTDGVSRTGYIATFGLSSNTH